MRFPPVLALLIAAPAAAQGPLNEPVPLEPPPAQASPGDSAFDLISADRALSLGFPSAAAGIYRSLLALPGADAGRLTLDLASALLDDGDVAGAGRALEAYSGARGAGWHLRQGLVDAHFQRTEQARAELAAVRLDDLDASEKGWYHFLEAMLADASNEPLRAISLYQQAASSAVSDLERARFVLAEEQVRLRVSKVTEDQISADRKNAEKFQNQKIGYGFTREYAIALNAAGRGRQAVDVLLGALRTLPPEERTEVDHFRILIGLISGAGNGVGRQELFELVSTGSDPDLQRAALQLLDNGSPPGPLRAELGERLDRLIAEPKPHPILESLLACRAELALGAARLGETDSASLYAKAEDSANALLQRYPGSPLKAHAFAVLAGSAWEQQRYRTAADYGIRASAELPPGQVRSTFGVLVAEAWYRAGVQGDRADFKSAADAYAAALRSRPAGVAPGLSMFQEVQSEIEAGELRAAENELDALSRDRAFDADDRWEAEWNLARSLEVHGDTDAAYDRVNRLLAGGPSASLRPALRARMAWLQARLSFDAKKPKETLRLVDSLSAATEGLPEALGTDIRSTSALLRAQASFAMGRTSEAEDALLRLRQTYPTSDSAVYSYIVEADWAAQQDKVIDAERLLTKLSDSFPSSRYAPYALYEAALQAERLGTDENLREADKFLESLVTKYPDSDLVFAARMRQGDILRELNEFPQAQQAYESLVNSPSAAMHPDNTILAQLALAECHNAQSADSPSHADAAKRIFQDLVDRVAPFPADVRAEAGYNLGAILARTSPDKAEAVWWNDVVDPFLVKAGGSGELGAKGRWWLARTLLDAGALYERQGKLEEARRAWSLIVDSGLPGGSLARQRLARFNLPAPRA